MSRTDAHRPRFVWIADHPELVRERHDHRTGSCTLAGDAPAIGWQPDACYRDLSWEIRLCSCPLCSGHLDREVERRSERRAVRDWLRAGVRGASAEECELLEGRARRRRF